MSRERKALISLIIIALTFNLLVITAGLRHDINELEEKTNRIVILVNKVGDIE